MRAGPALLTVLALPGLIGLGAVLSHLVGRQLVEAELQAVADLAAVAGARHLDGSEAGVEAATAAAERVVARNRVRGVPLDPRRATVVVGARADDGQVVPGGAEDAALLQVWLADGEVRSAPAPRPGGDPVAER